MLDICLVAELEACIASRGVYTFIHALVDRRESVIIDVIHENILQRAIKYGATVDPFEINVNLWMEYAWVLSNKEGNVAKKNASDGQRCEAKRQMRDFIMFREWEWFKYMVRDVAQQFDNERRAA